MKISTAVKEYIRCEVANRAKAIEEDITTKYEERGKATDKAKYELNKKYVELIAPHLEAIAPELEKLALDGTTVKACVYGTVRGKVNLNSTLLERAKTTDFYLIDPILEKLGDAKREFARNKEKVVLRLVAMLELDKITTDDLDKAIDEEVKGLAA